MMAMSNVPAARPSIRLRNAVLSLVISAVLGMVGLMGLAGVIGILRGLVATDTLWGPYAPQTLFLFGRNLLMAMVAFGGLLWLKPWKAVSAMGDLGVEDRPETFQDALFSFLLAMLALFGFSAAGGTVAAILFNPRIQHPVNWLTWANLALFLLIGGAALWSLLKLKPWTRREPMSPATRKTNALFGISGITAVPGCLLLVLSTSSRDDPAGFFSNSPVAPWIAAIAIVSWLLGMTIGWWWYFSADEHEQKAYDFGSVVGAGVFTVLTPVWWVAARAGLVPQPDAMVLWGITMVVITIGWFWHRYR